MFIKLKNGIRVNIEHIVSYYKNEKKNRVEIQTSIAEEIYICHETVEELDELILK